MTKVKYHFIPADHWMNDPNGFIYYKGQYHLFYQYFPYDYKWGTMHWGHKTSPDLIHWQDEGIALYPSRDFDRNGCFSGCALEVNDKMYLYYTAIIYSKLNPANIHVSGDEIIASQAMIISDDGYHFDPANKKVIIPTFKENDPIGHINHTRDPKVWKEEDCYYMVLGSKYYDDYNQSRGQLLFYTSDDAIHWSYLNKLKDERIKSNMWECPDMFKLDNKRVLIMSPEHILNDDINYPSHAMWSLVDFDNKTGDCSIEQLPQLIDYGLDFYAPQTTIDEDGQRVIIGWLRMPQCDDEGKWIGMFTYPRVLDIKENHLYFRIHPHIDALFTREVHTFSLKPMKISADLKEGSYLSIGGYEISYHDGVIYTNREKVFINHPDHIGVQFKTPKLNSAPHIDIYADYQAIEIYVNEGEYVISHIVYHLKENFKTKDVDNLHLFTTKEEL